MLQGILQNLSNKSTVACNRDCFIFFGGEKTFYSMEIAGALSLVWHNLGYFCRMYFYIHRWNEVLWWIFTMYTCLRYAYCPKNSFKEMQIHPFLGLFLRLRVDVLEDMTKVEYPICSGVRNWSCVWMRTSFFLKCQERGFNYQRPIARKIRKQSL